MNIIVSWAGLVDSAGKKVGDYALHWGRGSTSPFNAWNLAWQLGTELCYVFYLFFATLSVKIMEFVSDPKWLDGLVKGYQNITERMFSVVNPILLAAFTFTVLMVYVLLDKVRTSSMGMERRDVERVGAGLVLLCTVVVLALNPFGLMRFALSLVGSATSALTGTDGNVSTSPSLVDAVLRTPTLAINYAGGRAHENSPGCTDDDWSRLANGFTGTHCIEPKADYGTSIHFFLAGTALGMAFTLLIFALCVLYKFVKHLSFAVIGLVLLPWVAAASMLKRRSFDLLTRTFAVAAGNLIMAVVVQVFAISGPLFAALLLDSFLAGSGTSVVLSMIGLMLVYMGVTLVLLYVTRKSSALVRALRADASTAMHTFMAAPGAPGAFFGMVNNRMSQTNQTMNMLRQQLRRLRMLPSEDDTMSDRSTRTDLTPVQKVVDFGKRKYLSARVLNMGGAARNTAFTTNRVFAPSHTTSTAQSQLPGAPGSEVALRDAAGTLRGVSRDMALSATDMRAAATYSMLSEHARTTAPRQGITVSPTTVVSANVTPAVTVNPIVAIPGGGAINALSDTASDPNAVRKAIFDAQRNNPYPAFGARTSNDEVKRIVADTVKEVEARRSEAIRARNNTAGVIDAEVISVVDTPQPSQKDTLAAYRNVRAARERSSARNLDEFSRDIPSEAQAQSVARAPRGGRSRVDTYPSMRPQRGQKYSAQYKGASCTRGDTTVTVSQQVLRTGEAEAVAEAEVNRARARGETVVIRIPASVSSLVLTPDNPGMAASSPGVGFGDRVW